MAIWIALFAVAACTAVWLAYSGSKERLELSGIIGDLRQEVDSAKRTLSRSQAEHAKAMVLQESQIAELRSQSAGLRTIIDERKSQFPWLATAIADFEHLEAKKAAEFLRIKKHPAMKAAEIVSEYGLKRRDAEKELRLARYRVEYYEHLFPWIIDYVGDDVPDSVVDVNHPESTDGADPATNWLSKAEFESLATADKFQKAFDNWKRRKKTNWEIGREYERYVGYLYETQGFEVEYTGAIEGFADMGRDIIARQKSEILVIQCKYWRQEKRIREKHIFQLFGTSLEYAYRLGGFKKGGQLSLFETPIEVMGVKPIIYTSTVLSEEARQAAQALRVEIFENARISDYPMIKCNIASGNSDKIYHLPFDQQYDRTKIEFERGECFVYTVAEAERLGFRRAWRWRQSGLTV